MKKIVRKIIPPILFDFYVLLRYGRKGTTYKGIFNSYQESISSSKQESLYLNQQYDTFAVDEFYESINNQGLNSRSTQRDGLLVELILQLKFKNIKANILDYGGANNPQLSHLSIEERNNSTHFIIDRKELISRIKSHNKFLSIQPNINLLNPDDLGNINEKLDIAFFGSTIQYLDEFIKILNLIKEKECKYTIVCDRVFTNSSYDFYVLQMNMKPSIFPNKWHSRELFQSNLDELGYKIIWEC